MESETLSSQITGNAISSQLGISQGAFGNGSETYDDVRHHVRYFHE